MAESKVGQGPSDHLWSNCYLDPEKTKEGLGCLKQQ